MFLLYLYFARLNLVLYDFSGYNVEYKLHRDMIIPTMETKMKISFTPIVLGLAIMLPVHADLVSDSEQIMGSFEIQVGEL